ncbi:MAG: tetratricopeptide repeat protein [Candidatus Omnitrophota bacterium]
MFIKRLTQIFVIFAICICSHVCLFAEKEDFFSYDRFYFTPKIISKVSPKDKIQQLLKDFTGKFEKGLDYLSVRQPQKAEKYLKEARQGWPEYYGTDFLIALIYEEYGDYPTAARYYKSYLNKLKDLHNGIYRISGPMIRGFSSGPIEQYSTARFLVEQRLQHMGIDLNRVMPVFTFPIFLLPVLLAGAISGIYMLINTFLLPFLKKQRYLKYPPEGFWVCRYCFSDNPELAKECDTCGKPRIKSR